MGNRLARFGFGLDAGETLTPALMEQYLREQILSSYATAEGLSDYPTSTSTNPFAITDNSYLKQQASAVNAARASRGLSPRPFAGGGGFGGLQAVAPRQTGFGETAYGKDFWGTIFGGNAPNPNSFDIAGLGYSEADALTSLETAFANDPNLSMATFRSAQNQADALQKIRDSKISGGPIFGPLRVLTAGLGFPGSALPFASSLANIRQGMGQAIGDFFSQANPELYARLMPPLTSASQIPVGLATAPTLAQAGTIGFTPVQQAAFPNALGLGTTQAVPTLTRAERAGQVVRSVTAPVASGLVAVRDFAVENPFLITDTVEGIRGIIEGANTATVIPETGASGYTQPRPGSDFANPFAPSLYDIPPAPNYFDYDDVSGRDWAAILAAGLGNIPGGVIPSLGNIPGGVIPSLGNIPGGVIPSGRPDLPTSHSPPVPPGYQRFI